jgi:hypothetical protein
VPIIDERTGAVSREWYRWFYNLYTITGEGLGVTPVINGGTGLSTIPTNGQLLIGNGTGYDLNTLATGSGISVTNGVGTITLANTGVLSLSGGATGLSPTTATTGAVTLGGILNIANGGTFSVANPTAGAVAYGDGSAYKFTAVGTAGQLLTSAGAAVPTWSNIADIAVTSLSFGTTGLTPSTATKGAITVAGTLAVANGGTGLTSTPANGALDIGNGTGFTRATLTAGSNITITNSAGGISIASSNPGGTVTSVSFTGGIISVATATTTPALTVAGTSGGIPYFSSASTWASSAALTQYGVVYGGGAGATPVATAAGTTGQVLTATTGGAPTWAAPATSGTVTSVAQSFTGGLISVAGSPITSSGTLALTVAGTSGGIPYFSGASTWASSAALAANDIVLGGGAGAAPATTTTGTGVVTALGVNTGTAGAFVVNGGALGTPSSGTVTNLTGTASININGTVGATTANTGAFTTLSATGVTTVQAGTAALPAIIKSGDTDTGIFFPAANTIGIATGGGERLRVNSSGNVGIGTTSPQGKLNLSNAGAAGFEFFVTSPSGGVGTYIQSFNRSGGAFVETHYYATSHTFRTSASTTSMVLDTGGIVTMSAYGAGAATFSAAGVISSVSDETWKIKDGVPTNPDAMLKKLEPGYWYYNDEKKETFGADRQLGFYAQNVNAAIGPEAAPIPEEGKPWGYYDRSVLAITVMSLQKALLTIESLTDRITALEQA